MLATTTLRHHRPNRQDLRNADPSRASLFYRVGGLCRISRAFVAREMRTSNVRAISRPSPLLHPRHP